MVFYIEYNDWYYDYEYDEDIGDEMNNYSQYQSIDGYGIMFIIFIIMIGICCAVFGLVVGCICGFKMGQMMHKHLVDEDHLET